MKASPKINLWVIEEKKKVNDFKAMISRLGRPDLEYLCHCLLMAREYDGYNDHRGDIGNFRKYDIQVELTIQDIMAGTLDKGRMESEKRARSLTDKFPLKKS